MRQQYIRQIVEAAEGLNATDPEASSALLRVVERLSGRPTITLLAAVTEDEDGTPMHVGSTTEAPARCEYEVGVRDGRADRLAGSRIRDHILAQLYGREYIQGYNDGYCVDPAPEVAA